MSQQNKVQAFWVRCRRRPLEPLSAIVVGTLVALLLILGTTTDPDHDSPLLSFYQTTALENLGVINLVSGIYLGYRAYDTLGETVALILAVTAASFMCGPAPAGRSAMPNPLKGDHTEQNEQNSNNHPKSGPAPAGGSAMPTPPKGVRTEQNEQKSTIHPQNRPAPNQEQENEG